MQLVLDLLVPGIIAGVSCYGMAKRVDVYDALLQGAAKGLEILLRILPALVTLLTVVAMLRASGALELAAELLAPALEWLGIPPETVGLMLVRPISGSAALGVGSELITTYGPDSTIGRTAAVMLCGDFNVWKHQSKDCHFLVVQQEVTRSAFQGQRRVGGGKIGNVGGPADLQFFHQQDIVGQFI